MGYAQELAKIPSASDWHTQGFGRSTGCYKYVTVLCHNNSFNYLSSLQSMLIRGLKVPLLCEFCFSFCVASWESYKEVSTCGTHMCNAISVFDLKASTNQEPGSRACSVNIIHAHFCANMSFCLHPRVNVMTTMTHMQLLSLQVFCSEPCSARVQLCTCISILPATMH